MKIRVGDSRLGWATKVATTLTMDPFSPSRALITNDRGPAHFSSLTGIKNFVFLAAVQEVALPQAPPGFPAVFEETGFQGAALINKGR
jgi:hypothetical protein